MKQKKKDLMRKVTEFVEYQGEDRVITSDEMQEIIDQSPKSRIISSKMPLLDEAIDGFESGELIVISGPTKGGKTLLSQSLTVYFLEQGIKSLWFTYELTPTQFFRAYKDNVPNFVMPRILRAYALEWVEDRIAEALGKHRIGVVFIDHLHFLFDLAKSKNSSVEIGQVVRFLKSIAVESNLIIFLLCHLQKLDVTKEPDHSNFRDSSFIAQESDTGMLIWRVKNSDNEAWLKVCYSRRTGTWEKKIKIVKNKDGLLEEVQSD